MNSKTKRYSVPVIVVVLYVIFLLDKTQMLLAQYKVAEEIGLAVLGAIAIAWFMAMGPKKKHKK